LKQGLAPRSTGMSASKSKYIDRDERSGCEYRGDYKAHEAQRVVPQSSRDSPLVTPIWGTEPRDCAMLIQRALECLCLCSRLIRMP